MCGVCDYMVISLLALVLLWFQLDQVVNANDGDGRLRRKLCANDNS